MSNYWLKKAISPLDRCSPRRVNIYVNNKISEYLQSDEACVYGNGYGWMLHFLRDLQERMAFESFELSPVYKTYDWSDELSWCAPHTVVEGCNLELHFSQGTIRTTFSVDGKYESKVVDSPFLRRYGESPASFIPLQGEA